jgi:hypothetical protein
MWEEYKLLQEKIDKIGDFRFRIKSWAMTLITGFIVGGFASDIPTILYLVGLPIICMFHIFDLNQSIWHTAFIQRLSRIEFLLRTKSKPVGSTKYFARERKTPGVVAAITEAMKTSKSRRWNRWIVIPIHNLFYFVLYSVILATFIYSQLSIRKDKSPSQDTFKTIIIEQDSEDKPVENP